MKAYGVQGRYSRQFLADDVDEAPVDWHLGSRPCTGMDKTLEGTSSPRHDLCHGTLDSQFREKL